MNHRKANRPGPKRRPRKRKLTPPRTLEAFNRLPAPSREAYTNSLHALAKMRTEGVSLAAAARDNDVDPRTVRRWAKAALRKRSGGQYAPRASDQLLRVLMIPAQGGPTEMAVRGSRQASEIAQYWAAVHKYLATGDLTGLAPFQGQRVFDVSGEEYTYLTDPDDLDDLGGAGVLSFESIYRST